MHVLLAVDHSLASNSAVAFLRALPFRSSVDLHVVTVMPQFPFAETDASSRERTLFDQERHRIELMLAESLAQFDDAFRSVNREVRTGTPGHELTKFAEQQGTDLIVMGAVGRSALERVLLGSVSEYVANRTQSSVLIVRLQTSEKTAESRTAPRRILVALDNSDQDMEVANWIRHLELPASTEVRLVHVMQLMAFFRQDIIQQMTESWKQSREAVESRAESLSGSVRAWGFDATSRVIDARHVGDALISFADEHNCDLIITGDRRHGTINRLFLGSVSRHVLRYAKCSVLVARRGQL